MNNSVKALFILFFSFLACIIVFLYDIIIMRGHLDRELLIIASYGVLGTEILIAIGLATALNIMWPKSNLVKVLSLCIIVVIGMLLLIERENKLYLRMSESFVWILIIVIIDVFVIGVLYLWVKYPRIFKEIKDDILDNEST